MYRPRPKDQHPNKVYWDHIREVVLSRDGWKCRTCGTDEPLHAHHVTYERFGEEHAEDLITLCASCHAAITTSVAQRRDNGANGIAEYLEPKTEFERKVSNILARMDAKLSIAISEDSGKVKGDKKRDPDLVSNYGYEFCIKRIIASERGVLKKTLTRLLQEEKIATRGTPQIAKIFEMVEGSPSIIVTNDAHIKRSPGRPSTLYVHKKAFLDE